MRPSRSGSPYFLREGDVVLTFDDGPWPKSPSAAFTGAPEAGNCSTVACDGTYVVEFRTAAGERLTISVPGDGRPTSSVVRTISE